MKSDEIKIYVFYELWKIDWMIASSMIFLYLCSAIFYPNIHMECVHLALIDAWD